MILTLNLTEISSSEISHFKSIPKFLLIYKLSFLDMESLHKVKSLNKFFYNFVKEHFCEKFALKKLKPETSSACLCKCYKLFAEKLNIDVPLNDVSEKMNIFSVNQMFVTKFKDLNADLNQLLNDNFQKLLNKRINQIFAQPSERLDRYETLTNGMESHEEKNIQTLLDIGAKFSCSPLTINSWQRNIDGNESEHENAFFGDYIEEALNCRCSTETIKLLLIKHSICQIKGHHLATLINHLIYKYPEETLLLILEAIDNTSLRDNIFYINLTVALRKNYSDDCLLKILNKLPWSEEKEGFEEALKQKRSEQLLLKLAEKLVPRTDEEGYDEFIKIGMMNDCSEKVLEEIIRISGRLSEELTKLAKKKKYSQELIESIEEKKNGCMIF